MEQVAGAPGWECLAEDMDPEEVAVHCQNMDGWENSDDEVGLQTSDLEGRMLMAIVPHDTQELILGPEERETRATAGQQEEKAEGRKGLTELI